MSQGGKKTAVQTESNKDAVGEARTSGPKLKKIEDWVVADVIEWLKARHLHKFIILFQKHHVTGSDVINLRLPFLDDYQHVTVDEREHLLAELYDLLHPVQVSASHEDLTKIKSPTDKRKYYAAIELAKTKSSSLPHSMSVFTVPSHNASARSSSSSSVSSPSLKPRHKSESGVESNRGKLLKFEPRLAYTKKRKTPPKLLLHPIRPIYEYLRLYGPHCVQCLELSQQHTNTVSMATDGQGHVTINEVPPELQDRLHPGDRVIEINGHLLQPHLKKDMQTHIHALLNLRSPATLVVLTELAGKSGNGYSEAKWQKLQSMLVEMRDLDLPLDDHVTLSDMSADDSARNQDQYLKHTKLLQAEIRKLEEKVREHAALSETLRIELEDKDAIMHDLELSRDKAINKLRQTSGKIGKKNSRESVGGMEYYNMTMASFNIEEASKEEVVNSLKEIVMEASKQKWYLDRLISLIIEESPWLLDEVDADFDSLVLTDQSEELC